MVPVLTKNGTSFKGAAAYYLHDKRQEGEAERLTSDRVAWTQTVNLLTDDPERAWRMMVSTALAQSELKAAAGVKATGRKLETPVLAYSLAWHPDEKPDQAEQLAAAKASLKVLGLEEHQALIVSHRDEPHAHVHIVVNRVHPTDGKAATLSKSKLALSKWAEAYERERGKILCPARPDNNAKRKKGEAVNEPRKSRQQHEAEKGVANDSLTAEFIKSEQKQRDAALVARGKAMHESHRRQWDALKRTYSEGKSRVHAFGDKRKEQVTAAVKEAFKPQWADLFKRQRREHQQFSFREFTFLGRMQNIGAMIKAAGWQDGTARQILGAVFNLASGQRMQAFTRQQEGERMALARTVKASTSGAVGAVRKETRADLDRLRDDYLTRCENLKAEQTNERDALKQEWRDRNAERREAFAMIVEERPGRTAEHDSSREAGQGAMRERTRDIKPGGFTPG